MQLEDEMIKKIVDQAIQDGLSELIREDELATQLKTSQAYLAGQRKQGLLPARKVGNSYYYPISGVAALLVYQALKGTDEQKASD